MRIINMFYIDVLYDFLHTEQFSGPDAYIQRCLRTPTNEECQELRRMRKTLALALKNLKE